MKVFYEDSYIENDTSDIDSKLLITDISHCAPLGCFIIDAIVNKIRFPKRQVFVLLIVVILILLTNYFIFVERDVRSINNWEKGLLPIRIGDYYSVYP